MSSLCLLLVVFFLVSMRVWSKNEAVRSTASHLYFTHNPKEWVKWTFGIIPKKHPKSPQKHPAAYCCMQRKSFHIPQQLRDITGSEAVCMRHVNVAQLPDFDGERIWMEHKLCTKRCHRTYNAKQVVCVGYASYISSTTSEMKRSLIRKSYGIIGLRHNRINESAS